VSTNVFQISERRLSHEAQLSQTDCVTPKPAHMLSSAAQIYKKKSHMKRLA